MDGGASATTGRQRLLLVHAHPDDESIQNGATMARYAAQGVHVTLVTCTRGERGEVIPARLAHLEGDGDALAAVRERELADAVAALGVRDHRFLGEDAGARYVDSGMAYAEDGSVVPAPDTAADAFARVPLDEPATHLARVLRQVRPHVVVTYDPGGGYGHPDHVRTHEVTTRAVELAADPGATVRGPAAGEQDAVEPWSVPRVFWTVAPREATLAAWRALAAAGARAPDPDGPLPSMLVPDDEVTTTVDAAPHLPAKVAALRAHATQVVVTGSTFALSNGVHQPLTGVEHYRMVRPNGPAAPADDLFG
ncbi:N-acetyl-1-D-myo-inositol-2-amino-2-deoxy-alpha-D-glucopyranoside deacetylase [Thalassiella azotivora]